MFPSTVGVVGPIPYPALGFSQISAEIGLKHVCLKRAGVSPNFSPISAEIGPIFFSVETPETINLTIFFRGTKSVFGP